MEDSVMGKRALPWMSLALAALGPGSGRADGADAVLNALLESKPLVDIRLRSESVDQTGLGKQAVAGLDSLALTATYDDFSAARLGQHYGSEVDLQLQGKWRRFMGLVKLADYAADKFATTTRKLWFELDYIW
jgi:hypothetical protein